MYNNMDKVKKLRISAKILWILGCFLTYQFIAGDIEISLQAGITLVFVCAIQYVFTQAESIAFDGTLPYPWTEEFRSDSRYLGLLIGSLVILLLDMVINLGGVHDFITKLQTSDSGKVLEQEYVQDVDTFMRVFEFLLSLVLCIGSEMLNALADLKEGKAPKREQRSPKQQNSSAAPKIKEHRPSRSNDMSDLEELLKGS